MKRAILLVFVATFLILPDFIFADTIVSAPISSDTTWSPAGGVYVIDSNFSITSGTTLTIEPGTIIKAKTTGVLGLGISGRLVARGTSNMPVYFTSWSNDSVGGDTNGDGSTTLGAPGGWQGLHFKPGSEGIFDHVDFSYSGSGGQGGYGNYIGIENDGGVIDIKHSNIHDNYANLFDWVIGHYRGGYGIYNKSGTLSVSDSIIDNSTNGINIESGTTTVSNTIIKNNDGYSGGYGIYAYNYDSLTLLNNTFSNNKKTAFVYSGKNFIHSGNVSEDQTNKGFEISGIISNDTVFSGGDLPLIIHYLSVEAGKTLTIEPGTILKMNNFYGAIVVNGNLIAKGAGDRKIYITSLRDDFVGGDTNGDGNVTSPGPRSWSALFLEAGSKAQFDNVVIRYGGYNYNGEYLPGVAAAIYNRGAEFSVSNSLFERNAGTAIFQDAGATTINHSELSNGDYGILSRGGGIKISQSDIHGNFGISIDNQSGPTIDARNNWWGNLSGPHDVSTTTPTGAGSRISGNILYIPFLKNLGDVPLTTKAANLAKQVIEAPYLGDGDTYGGKGWDSKQNLYVTVDEIFNGYNYWNNKLKKVAFGAGVDCSGLVQWAFNNSFDPSKSLLRNVIRYDSADGQYRNNTKATTEADLKPGDLLFLDKGNDNFIDHVAMYVGDSGGYDIVEAFSPRTGIVPADEIEFKERPGFIKNKHFRQVTPSPKIPGKIKVGSPVDLIVTDPDGFTITPATAIQTEEEYLNEIPGELYYSESELGHDGQPEDVVYWPYVKTGDFLIKVKPDPNAGPNATYSLYFTLEDNTTTLAQNMPISQIPSEGYGVTVGNDQEVNSFIPVMVDIKPDSYPNTVNFGSKGVVPVAIFGSETFDVKEVDVNSIKLSGATPKIKGDKGPIFSYSDLNKDGFNDLLIKISTESFGLDTGDTQLNLEGSLKSGIIIKGSDSINIVPQKS